MNFRRGLLYLLLTLAANGCGIGLCIGNDNGTCSTASEVSPRLLLSGLQGLTIRKNDCYPVTLSALDAADNLITTINTAVTISASSGVVIYSSLQGCQTYDTASEQSTFALTSLSPTVVFYFRSDAEGPLSLGASTADSVGLASATQSVSVEYTPFDGSQGPDYYVNAIAQDSLNRYYLAGGFQSYDEFRVQYLARLDGNGEIDTSFAPTGTGLNGAARTLSIQTDNKIIVGGSFTTYNGTSRPYTARLDTDGSLDTSFAPTGTGFNSTANAVALQADGKVVVGGAFTSYNSTARPYIARLNADGSLDTSFAPVGSGLSAAVNAVALQSDGKVLVGGTFVTYNGASRPYIARLNTDGSLDGTFTPTGTGLGGTVYSLALQSDGKVVVGGGFLAYHVTSRPYVARLNSDGSLDVSFAPTGTGLNAPVNAVTLQTDGKVLVGGDFISYNGTLRGRMARLNTDGSLDSAFGASDSGFDSWVYSIFLQSDAAMLVGGQFTSHNGAARARLARINSDGSLTSDFATSQTSFNGHIQGLSIHSDGTILVGGLFTAYRGTARGSVACLNSDGSLNTAFAPSGTGFDNTVYTVARQTDGKVVAGGEFLNFNGTSRTSIARLNADGSLDTGFTLAGAGLDGHVATLVFPGNDKILIGGSFISYDSTPRIGIARLNSDGSLDTGFALTGNGLDGEVSAITLQPDGKVILGGSFSSYDGTMPRPFVARLNADGSLDTSFAPTGTGLSNFVYALALQTDGKILVGGNFLSYNGTSRRRIARLNSDGSVDTSFTNAGTGLSSSVYAISVQTDGKAIAGGWFSSYNGTARSRIARLNADGRLDTSFGATGTGFNGNVSAVTRQSDGKILVGGLFTSFDGKTANYLARLTFIGTPD